MNVLTESHLTKEISHWILNSTIYWTKSKVLELNYLIWKTYKAGGAVPCPLQSAESPGVPPLASHLQAAVPGLIGNGVVLYSVLLVYQLVKLYRR